MKKEVQDGKETKRGEKGQQLLEVILTDEEKLKYAKEVSKNLAEVQRKEEGLTAIKSQYKAEIDALIAGINKLAVKIDSGKEYRMVDVETTTDYEAGRKIVVRLDTEATVSDIPIPQNEQIKL